MNPILLRKTAKEQGLTRYFTGKPCATAGHVSERATRNGECLECAKIRLNAWRESNPEKQAAHRKNHFLRHPEKERAQHKNWLLAEPARKEKYRLQKNSATANWAKNNKHKRNFSEANRRAHKLTQTPIWLNQGHLFEMECVYGYCAALRSIGLDYEVDHIAPIKGKLVSGLHTPWNLQILTAFENRSKGNRELDHAKIP